jgi:NTP pyrophosphatase (non-canonical NTP hydrolase)
MTPRIIRDSNLRFARPAGWDEARHGPWGELHARVTGDLVETAWYPTPEELTALNRGGVVILAIVGGQPPVSLKVEPAEAAVPLSTFGTAARPVYHAGDEPILPREPVPVMRGDERMDRFNGLSDAEAERLALLLEELGEAQQAIGKILRHGYESYHPDTPSISNRRNLQRELGDIFAAIALMFRHADISVRTVAEQEERKLEKLPPYLHETENVEALSGLPRILFGRI